MGTQEQGLGQLCFQIHLGRASGLGIKRLKEKCEALAKSARSVRGIGFTQGEDNGAYLNIVFATDSPLESWNELRAELLETSDFGVLLKASCICVCTGEDGWNDYRLLSHFDPAVSIDATGND